MLHPDFPVAEGRVGITTDWSLALPGRFNRRIEDGDLVFWRPGFTLWIAAWGNDHNLSPVEQLAWIKEEASADAFDLQEADDGSVARFGYRIDEAREGVLVHAHYSFTAAASGYLQIAQYVDAESDLAAAMAIWQSVRAEPVT